MTFDRSCVAEFFLRPAWFFNNAGGAPGCKADQPLWPARNQIDPFIWLIGDFADFTMPVGC